MRKWFWIHTHPRIQECSGLLWGNFKLIQGTWAVRVHGFVLEHRAINFIQQLWADTTLSSLTLLTYCPDNISVLYCIVFILACPWLKHKPHQHPTPQPHLSLCMLWTFSFSCHYCILFSISYMAFLRDRIFFSKCF